MHISGKIKRSAWWMIPVVLLVLSATVVPAVAGITYNPSNAANNPAGIRLADQPRTCHDPYGCTSDSGGNFTDGQPAIAAGANGNTHYLYAVWTADRQGTEDTPLVPYGSFNTTATGNCNDATAGIVPFAERTVTDGSWASGVITFTVDVAGSPHVFVPGDTVAISGSSNAAYDGTYSVLASPAPTPTTFAVAKTVDPGAGFTGGAGFADRIGNCGQVYFGRAAASRPATTTVAVTAAAWVNCTTVPVSSTKCIRYTTAAAHGLTVGDTANVFGNTPREWNYSGPIWAVPTTTTFQVPAGRTKFYAQPAALTTPGVVYKNAWAWDGGKSGGGGGPACVIDPVKCDQYGTDSFPVSPSNQHVEGMSIASSGPYVYVMWTNTIGYYSQMCQNEPRVLWVRVNSHYGDADSWGDPIKLSAGTIAPGTTDTDRVDYPSIAAKGDSVYVIHTNSNNGDIIVDESNNNGGAWTTSTIGHTNAVYDDGVMTGVDNPPLTGLACPGAPLLTAPFNNDPSVEGYEGMPVIAATSGASGGAVGAAWQSNDGGRIRAKIAIDSNANTTVSDNWTSGPQNLTPSGGKGAALRNNAASLPACPYSVAPTSPLGTTGACMPGNLAVDAATGRIGFAFLKDETSGAGPSGAYYRQWTSASGWAPKRLVGCFDQPSTGCGSGAPGFMATEYNDGYAPGVALYGTSGVGLNFSACSIATDGDSCNHPEVLFKESGDGITFHDGCPAGTPCGRFQIIANNRWDNGEVGGVDQTCSAVNLFQCTLNSSVNDYPNIVFDNPAVSGTVGCSSQVASDPPGLPVPGCKTSHYFIGRNSYYGWYRVYIVQGTQT